MKIGNGPLEIAILGISEDEDDKFSLSELRELAESGLDIHPLGKIFGVTFIDSLVGPGTFFGFPFEMEAIKKIKSKNNIDLPVIVKRRCQDEYVIKEGFIYCEPNPLLLAHELGHSLGLKHPSFKCGTHCSEDYMRNRCPHSKYIMGCAGSFRDNADFSPTDADELKNFLK